jgi:hypothetical protein
MQKKKCASNLPIDRETKRPLTLNLIREIIFQKEVYSLRLLKVTVASTSPSQVRMSRNSSKQLWEEEEVQSLQGTTRL